MKKTLLGSLILLALAGNVQATVNDKTSGKVTFFGKVVENTCEVKTDHKNLSVVLNDVGKNSLKDKGNTAMPTPFTITLQNCNPTAANGAANKANKVGLYFYSWENADKDNNFTLKNKTSTSNDFATMVNIQLMESNGTKEIKVVGKETEDFVHTNTGSTLNENHPTNAHISGSTQLNNVTGDLPLHFIAQYYSLGSTTAGKVQSSVDFQIAYE
ncbi:fimbrial protein [Haemophilus influenzae]|uniref:fimbrial protein n=1 Tax=Haemophilus influenzae TaxID=727 RepID=UPI000D20E603|nr:fimbrial protein [Haemophilus influenzae]AVJ03626.1 major fimbrial subunit [Haemophilus influenzae]AVJ05368.1 major fimbrial subunit [Haemophilus influenzae]MCK8798253.1 type 1 fimbrial protein [Haemophilus influenzae]MCK8888662.1 type 1 fimbrial protein [Haemophilus influenzae]MCK8967084.1 type 1 fimbrial protein [Haemophilus influenzae]